MSKKNAIPDPVPDVVALTNTVRVMKEIIEDLTGQRPGTRVAVPHLFVQPVRPDPRQVTVNLHDLWIASGTDRIHYFDGRLWRQVQA